MSCVLTIGGKKFDADAFVNKTKLKPYRVRYKGEPIHANKPKGKKQLFSSISIDVSEASFDDFIQQVNDAIRFLKKNKLKLTHILSTKEIEFANLDFGITSRLADNKIAVQVDTFPKELLTLAGNAGINIILSNYSNELFSNK